jgi:hypothetical protein
MVAELSVIKLSAVSYQLSEIFPEDALTLASGDANHIALKSGDLNEQDVL